MLSRGTAIAIGTGIALAWPGAALAGTTSSSYTTAGEHAFVVPSGVHTLNVRLIGGRGGAGRATNGSGATIPGGVPSTVMGILAVRPGQRLYLEVAGDGGAANDTGSSAPGINGGGAGGEIFAFIFGSVPDGGGGGGASDVRTCPETASACNSLLSRLIVAAGAGGGGGGSSEAAGGDGGAGDAAGVHGQADGHGEAGGGGGGRGLMTAPGAGGTGGGSLAARLGIGGSGQSSIGPSVGGGGGGIYGGGAGGDGGLTMPTMTTVNAAGAGGGGGGSSGVPKGARGVSGYQFVPSATGAQPLIKLTWKLPSPAVTTGLARQITKTSAVLRGHVNANGYPVTGCHFVISPGGRSLPCSQHLGAAPKAVLVSAKVSGLKPGTVYRFKLSSASANGTATGAMAKFKTV